MKKVFFLLLLCVVIQSVHAKYVMLDSLRYDINCTYKQKMVLHGSKTPQDIFICEFIEKDTLYIISNAFIQDYNEFTHEVPDVPTLVNEIMSICPTECMEGNCGYAFFYDSDLPSTLTIYTFPNMDTIQYVTTHFPELYAAIIRDTIFGSTNIRCGVSIQEILNRLSINSTYYDYTKYNHIVLIPETFTYSAYQKKGYVELSELCFQLKIKDGVVSQIMTKHSIYSGKVVRKFEQVYEYRFF